MPSKDNFYSTENIDELAMSIELVGHIEQNLVVKPEAHGKYEVVAGHRRRLAALKLVQEGKEEYRKVPCLIKKESDTIKDIYQCNGKTAYGLGKSAAGKGIKRNPYRV